MSQAEELLNSLSETVVEHEHSVVDTDSHFTINPDTRMIESTSRYKNVLMQYDHNSQRYTFELPRYIDGHDMSLCTSVVVNYDNVEDQTEMVNSSFYDVDDLKVDPDNSDMVLCSWLISRASTQLAGILSFSIEYKCTDDEGNVTYEFGTDTFSDVTVKPRKKNVEAEITEHVDVLEQWRTKIFGAGDSVMANITAEGEAQVTAINSEGTEQVAAVKMESETQQEAVELKGTETLESIPEDYTETSNKADEAVRSKSDAIVCEAEGESVVLTDSSNDHIRGLKVFGKSSQVTTTGKNLLNGKYLTGYGNRNGVNFTDAGDGKIGVNGTSTADTTFVFCSFEAGQRTLLPAGTYTVSGNPTDTAYLSFFVYSDQETSDVLVYNSAIIDGKSWTFTIDNDAYYGAYLYVGNGRTVSGVISPMLELGSTATAYEPYTGGIPSPNPEYPQEIESVESLNIAIAGKNLFNIDADVVEYATRVQSIEGNTITLNRESGDIWGDWFPVKLYKGVSYTVSLVFADREESAAGVCFRTSTSASENGLDISARRINYQDGVRCSTTIVPTKDTNYIEFYLQSAWNLNTYVSFKDVQIEVGKTATAYEPYKTIQSMNLTHTLPGIPVTSGGNFTDANGQQWICDEIDLERGVRTSRFNEVVVTGEENWQQSSNHENIYEISQNNVAWKTICSHYPHVISEGAAGDYAVISNYTRNIRIKDTRFSNDVSGFKVWLSGQYATGTPVKILRELTNPIEIPLTAEEITAFKALRTNYPNTTILNDAGAWMSVKYNADTKTYVENPKTLKLVDSSTGVVYELKIVDGNLTVTPV